MKTVSPLVLIITSLCWCLATISTAQDLKTDFTAWLDAFRVEANSAGISQKTLKSAFADIQEPLPRVIALDRKQPEFSQSLEDYVNNRVSEKRVEDGRRMLARYPTWLGRIERTYNVQRRFLVALWGIESNYGELTGRIPVIHALATLAHDGRRSGYFRRELLEALHILDEDLISQKSPIGSWAGAMGQCQFMPSSLRSYGVDADKNGHIDLWGSVPDVLASAANYLARAGWKDDQTWGRPVRLPDTFDFSLAGLKTRLPLARWQSLGVRRLNGRALPRRRDLTASLILPDGPGGPAYLVYDNFRALLSWNRSNSFAVAVGTLSDRIKAKQR